MAAIHRELEKYKETVSSMEMKTQWAQNKLKAELEAHKVSRHDIYSYILITGYGGTPRVRPFAFA